MISELEPPSQVTPSPRAAIPPPLKPLRVAIATPFGARGRGGMDRVTDLIMDRAAQAPELALSLTRLTTLGPRGKALGVLYFGWAVVKLATLCALGRLDVVHLNTAAFGSVYRKAILAAIARLFGVPYVLHIHAGYFGRFWAGATGRKRALIDGLVGGSAIILVLGREFAEMVAGQLPSVRDRIVILHNATPAKPEARPRGAGGGPVQITALGLLGPRKGTTQLIDALALITHRTDWSATIAGNGEVEKARAQVARLGLQSRVSVPGWVGGTAVDELLDRTDVLALPSFSEGLPMAILEAFAYGIAVVATPVNAIPDVVTDGRNGLLVPVGDVAALAAGLERLIADPALRLRLGAAGRADHDQLYRVEVYAERIAAIWRQAAAAR